MTAVGVMGSMSIRNQIGTMTIVIWNALQDRVDILLYTCLDFHADTMAGTDLCAETINFYFFSLFYI